MLSDGSKVLSKALFGNGYFFAVATAVAEFGDGSFTQRMVARRLGITDNLVKPNLERLEAADLLKLRHEAWERVPSPYWRFLANLDRELPALGGVRQLPAP